MKTLAHLDRQLFELKRFHKIRDLLLPSAHGFYWADQLEKVVPFWRFNYRPAQTIAGIVTLIARARRHLGSISARDINGRNFQTIDRYSFGFGFVFRSTAVCLLYLRDPPVDVRLGWAALSRA